MTAWNTLQWLGPELVKAGMVSNEDWILNAAERATCMFNDQKMRTTAVMMAVAAPGAIDYLESAPVLAVHCALGNPPHKIDQRKNVFVRFRQMMASYRRLRDMLDNSKIARPLRNIDASAWRVHHFGLMRDLGNVPPSLLAQSIPQSKTAQFCWLSDLSTWRTSILGAETHSVQIWRELFEWAVRTIGDAEHRPDVETVADLAAAKPYLFTDRWTWARAMKETEAWHAELARMTHEEKFLLNYKLGWSDPVDFTPLPVRRKIGGLEFIALRSGEDLFREGVAMHHCVSSYIRSLIAGVSRIYSVRDGEQRIATLELCCMPSVSFVARDGQIAVRVGLRQNSKWVVAQVKGPCNRPVARDVSNAISEFYAAAMKEVVKP